MVPACEISLPVELFTNSDRKQTNEKTQALRGEGHLRWMDRCRLKLTLTGIYLIMSADLHIFKGVQDTGCLTRRVGSAANSGKTVKIQQRRLDKGTKSSGVMKMKQLDSRMTLGRGRGTPRTGPIKITVLFLTRRNRNPFQNQKRVYSAISEICSHPCCYGNQ